MRLPEDLAGHLGTGPSRWRVHDARHAARLVGAARSGRQAPRLRSSRVRHVCGDDPVSPVHVIDGRPDQQTFGALDIDVRRNGFGRQRQSFECDLDVDRTSTSRFPLSSSGLRWSSACGPAVEVLVGDRGRLNGCTWSRQDLCDDTGARASGPGARGGFPSGADRGPPAAPHFLRDDREGGTVAPCQDTRNGPPPSTGRPPSTRRGRSCSPKLIRQLEVAAREGGADTETNPTLRTMFEKARAIVGSDGHDRTRHQAGYGRPRRSPLRTCLLRGLCPGRSGDHGRVPDRQPQPDRGRGAEHLLAKRRFHRRARSGRLAVLPQRRDRAASRRSTRTGSWKSTLDAGAENLSDEGDTLGARLRRRRTSPPRASALEDSGYRGPLRRARDGSVDLTVPIEDVATHARSSG